MHCLLSTGFADCLFVTEGIAQLGEVREVVKFVGVVKGSQKVKKRRVAKGRKSKTTWLNLSV